MLRIEDIPVEKSDEYWSIQFRYLVDDGMISTEDEKEYFQSSAYRNVLTGHMTRTPDTLHMVYIVRDDVRIGAAQYCTYKSEDGKCFILDFWVFPPYRGNGTGHQCFQALHDYTRNDGAAYYALNCAKEDSRRFWISIGFVDDGTDEYGSPRLIKVDQEI